MLPDAWSNEYMFPSVVPRRMIPLSVVGGLDTFSPSGNEYDHTFEIVDASIARSVLLFAKNTVFPPPNAGVKHAGILDDHKKFKLESKTVTILEDATATFPLVIDTAGDVSDNASPVRFDRPARTLYIFPLDVSMYIWPYEPSAGAVGRELTN
jgi:hypothetical protein